MSEPTPPADGLREALIREIHPDYPAPIPALNQLYEDHADRFLSRFEVRSRGPVTDAEVDAAYAAAMRNGAGQLTRSDIRVALEAARKVPNA